MNNNIKGTIVVLVVGGIFYLVHKNYRSKTMKPISIGKARDIVIKYSDSAYGGSHAEFVNKADSAYIQSWAKSIIDGQSTFVYNSRTYNTLGGATKK